ncbi:MAG TPA: molybdopterin dinucleotide binding domain-containing protein, partial [Methylomirabilota bacterium]|nr:molybdopterin dinucleotide binding domain-containing protein [Methylomirabilota bacterium]
MSDGIDRRGFFRLVGVSSAAAAAAAGCGKTTEAILPYVIPPDNLIPGVATWFATVCRECPAGCGVLAKNREGRVVKLEGNPDHPVNHGALCARGQASLLGTYDPDRIARPQAREGNAWKVVPAADAEKLLVEKLAAARSAGAGRIAMITQLETGSLGRLMDDWLKALGARPRVAHEPFASEALRAANRATFGVDALPYHAFEDARAVLSLGADYLETWISPVGYAGAFHRMHGLRDGGSGTVIHVEPRYSMTAANADEWVANAPGTEGLVALALLRIVLEERLAPSLPAKEAEALAAVARAVALEAVARQSGIPPARLTHIAETLARSAPSLVVGGGIAVTGPGAVDTAVAINLLNYALGNVGKTLRFGPNSTLGQASRYADLMALTQAMANGEIAVLLVKDANPVFTLPTKAGFADALAKVPFVVSLSSHLDETTARAHLVLPDLTPLESWGDYSPREGVWGLMQPAMGVVPEVRPAREDALDLVAALAPVRTLVGRVPQEKFPGVQTKAAGDLLLDTGRALVPGGEKGLFRAKTFADYLREAWQALAKRIAPGTTPFETVWEDALRRGGLWTEVPPARVQLSAGLRPPGAAAALEGPAEGLALLVVPSSRYYDGRSANKVWLHEAPDPITQAVYDNWIEIAAETANRLGIRAGDIVRVRSPHGQIELPAYVSETLHPGAVAVPTGLGHTEYGRFARAVGANPLVLLPAEADAASGGPRWLAVRVALERTGTAVRLATPAGVTEVDHQREIIETVRLAEAAALAKDGKAPPHANLPSMYPDLKYPEHRWGMTVDLDSCIGCQACVVACQAENNVPVAGFADVPMPPAGPNRVAAVGKWQVGYGRSLHWLRVERWWDRGHPAGAGGGHAGAPGAGLAHAAEARPAAPPRARFMPMLCQHCEVAPCEPVCPVFAAYHTPEGLNAQVYNRCVGTRYCGNNCPYMVRRFNWYRYDWPAPMTLQLNPDVAVRDRGVMEKCTMCIQRIIAGKDQAKDQGRRPRDGEILTACQQTCPTRAITFG